MARAAATSCQARRGCGCDVRRGLRVRATPYRRENTRRTPRNQVGPGAGGQMVQTCGTNTQKPGTPGGVGVDVLDRRGQRQDEQCSGRAGGEGGRRRTGAAPPACSDAGVKMPATRKNSGIPTSAPTMVASLSTVRTGSRTAGSLNTHAPCRAVHAIVTCATTTPLTSTTLRLSADTVRAGRAPSTRQPRSPRAATNCRLDLDGPARAPCRTVRRCARDARSGMTSMNLNHGAWPPRTRTTSVTSSLNRANHPPQVRGGAQRVSPGTARGPLSDPQWRLTLAHCDRGLPHVPSPHRAAAGT